MKHVLLFVIILPLYAATQTGIQWTSGLSWEEIKIKSRAENKYIFIDAYATWCKPCKEMDKEVFSNDTVSKYINANFLSVKAQMDRTGKDNKEVQSWYNDAAFLQKEYRITAFPTYIFLNSDGKIIHKVRGYHDVKAFVKEAQEATKPGKEYVNYYAEYEQLVMDYDQGKRNLAKMPYIVKSAKEVGDFDVARKIAKEYTDYLFSEGEGVLFNKESIEYFTSTYEGVSSKSRIFKLFYSEGLKVDRVMGKPGFADAFVDKTIKDEIINNYLGIYADPMLMVLKTPDRLSIPDWRKMYSEIKTKYSVVYARRNVLSAKIDFYFKTAMYEEWVKFLFQKIDRYGIDTITNNPYAKMNSAGWTIFQKIANRKYLRKACEFMTVVVERRPKMFSYLDTYANLLYKLGKDKEAMEWETKAIEATGERFSGHKRRFIEVLDKMKRGEPTWTGRLF